MSSTSSDSFRAEPATGSARTLFSYEIRREGRVVATLHGLQSAQGVTVETEVYPATGPAGEVLTRPFTFGSVEHARRFADEALMALEYLNCTVA